MMNKHQTIATAILGFLVITGFVFVQFQNNSQEAATLKSQKETEKNIQLPTSSTALILRPVQVINEAKELAAAELKAQNYKGVLYDFAKDVDNANKVTTTVVGPLIKTLDKIYFGSGQVDYTSPSVYLVGPPDGWITQNNGASFTQLSSYALWGAASNSPAPVFGRIGASSVYFKNKLWMFGGRDSTYTANTCPQNVWSSVNGSNWKLETSTVPWTGRVEASAVVFNNELYMIGGSTCIGTWSMISTDEVWKTSDGINWTLVPPSTKPFPRRSGAAAVVYQGAIHVLGGYSAWGATGFHNTDVTSTDGVNWTINTTPWPGRSDLSATVLNDKIYISGGLSSSSYTYPMVPFAATYPGSTIYSDVWSYKTPLLTGSSAQGWKLENANAAFGPRESHSMITANKALYVLGGNKNFTAPGYTTDSIYTSVDGATWKFVSTNAALARSHFDAVTLPGTFGTGTLKYPLVSSIQATSTNTSVDLKGSVDPQGQANTNAWFYYSVVDMNSNVLGVYETPHVPVTNPLNPFILTVSNLTPQQSVTYRVMAENNLGRVASPLYNQQTHGCDPSVTAPSLSNVYPSGGESFTIGQSITVTWESCNIPANAIIEVSIPGYGIISVSPNDGNQQITIPAYPGMRQVSVRVQNAAPVSQSMSSFLIHP